LQRFRQRQQDLSNIEAIPVARLNQLTYNVNRGENSQPLEDFSSFLPYPSRYLTVQQSDKTENISKEAARDFAKYYGQLSYKQKSAFEHIKLGLFEKAKS